MMKELIGLIGQQESVSFTVSRLGDGQIRLMLKGEVNREVGEGASDRAKKLHEVLERPVVVVASEDELSEASLESFLNRIAEARGGVRDALSEALGGFSDASKEALNTKEEGAKPAAAGKTSGKKASEKPSEQGEGEADSEATSEAANEGGDSLFAGVGP